MEVTKKEIKKLGELARIGINEKDAEVLKGDLEKTLSFISRLKELRVPEGDDFGATKTPTNNIREDVSELEGGEYTKELLEQASDIEDGFVKVKKVL
ncbi:MAG: aspartyl/glutamyl-tRNA amidotransferase subunit C [Candidatus Marinimicrobia bacterium]|nr:aspartyl/glutamyl-tRNA amidotransferase subunit C [Candidatus Neomarinimicrobiota bacterium]